MGGGWWWGGGGGMGGGGAFDDWIEGKEEWRMRVGHHQFTRISVVTNRPASALHTPPPFSRAHQHVEESLTHEPTVESNSRPGSHGLSV